MNRNAAQSTTNVVHATDVLGSALTAIDAIVADAQQHQRKKEQREATGPALAGIKRQRGGEVFAVMAEPHFRALQTIVLLYGVQLMPSLDAIMRRVLICVTSPVLVSSDCWELAAMLGTYFRAGAARLLEEVLALLLAERSPFLLGSPCVVVDVVASQGLPANTNGSTDISGKDRNAVDQEKVYDGSSTQRNLRAFDDLLVALGPFLPSSTMQQVALRYAEEVVVNGMLNAQASAGCSTGQLASYQERQQQQVEPQQTSVEAALRPQCVSLLTTLLTLCRPLPSNTAACAVRAVKELPMRSFSLYGGVEHHQLLRSVMRLSVTLTALRHPYAIPFYVPPRDVVERPTRRVTMEEGSDGHEVESAQVYPNNEKMPAVGLPIPISGGIKGNGGHSKWREEEGNIKAAYQSTAPTENKTVATPQRQPQQFEGTAEKYCESSVSPAVSQKQKPQAEPTASQAPLTLTVSADDEDDDVEIPEIDMED
ncbi:hypothetical protein, conserved [Trypanosoma brucei gambiense DAL972]|uniref:Uncharacterized protein n=1 Tax=Trypanosoma brucei gambiense (strain MHOM/CI/86/DAL972) TaxID=679716 RepID=D0A1Q2_TRYB9|nr:hypothetical protein, conserved [Trypanosoma brucei gambiense DAL972]CBH15195.1 hypothetical protein, conserved [Trypanosoma brucei gambiense DAL972]|eukprot:XP_011777460.1 hypothetical protein, conserved [Trypanosoma brucei gambiense DAL972]